VTVQLSIFGELLDAPPPSCFFHCSYGNDSLAMLQWGIEAGLPRAARCVVVYSDTGWAAPWWAKRVKELEAWAVSHGYEVARTSSVGMLALVERERGWPRHGMQFCTEHLKIRPGLALMSLFDPNAEAMVMIGKRRAESNARSDTPEFVYGSAASGGRTVRHPLYLHDDGERNALLDRAGFSALPHRSDECFPCVNANKEDIVRLAEHPARVAVIREQEAKLGTTAAGKPRTMFRPAKKMGATGIDQIVRWAKSKRGQFNLDDGTGPSETATGCDSGVCGG
jgi:3'-phosphoadenosine 5'-phosphosulfate sulfotransferase (PAPS reductase)/FAD synthetase